MRLLSFLIFFNIKGYLKQVALNKHTQRSLKFLSLISGNILTKLIQIIIQKDEKFYSLSTVGMLSFFLASFLSSQPVNAGATSAVITTAAAS